MAERVGFEPTVRFPVRSLSRRVLSTAQPPLRGLFVLLLYRYLVTRATRRFPLFFGNDNASPRTLFLKFAAFFFRRPGLFSPGVRSTKLNWAFSP